MDHNLQNSDEQLENLLRVLSMEVFLFSVFCVFFVCRRREGFELSITGQISGP
jgi:hypothetical protein